MVILKKILLNHPQVILEIKFAYQGLCSLKERRYPSPLPALRSVCRRAGSCCSSVSSCVLTTASPMPIPHPFSPRTHRIGDDGEEK